MPRITSVFNKVAEIELVYRRRPAEAQIVSSTNAAYTLFRDTWDEKKIDLQEQVRVMLLDRRFHCLGIVTLATGGISSCVVDLRLAFAAALKARASAIILAHNHPSGYTWPSEDDKALTRRFVEAGKILDVAVQDHLIVTRDKYTSFANLGIL